MYDNTNTTNTFLAEPAWNTFGTIPTAINSLTSFNSKAYYPLSAYTGNTSQEAVKTLMKQVSELNQEDIDMRSRISLTYLAHTKKLIAFIFQNIQEVTSDTYLFNNVLLSDKPYPVDIVISTGYLSQVSKLSTLCFSKEICCFVREDIIAIYACFRNVTYKEAIRTIYDCITNNTKLFPHTSSDEASYWVQEKNSIVAIGPNHYDTFLTYIPSYKDYNYYNRNNNPIGINYTFKNKFGDSVSIFYCFWRHSKSTELHFAPCSRKESNIIFTQEWDKEGLPSVVIHNSEQDCIDNSIESCFNISLPFKANNIHKLDLTPFKDKTVYISAEAYMLNEISMNTPLISSEICKSNSYSKNSLIKLQEQAKKLNIEVNFFVKMKYPNRSYVNDPIHITQLLQSLFPVEDINNSILPVELKVKSGFIPAGENLPNHDRIRKEILSPLIQSGTITWLFAKEKVGKTLFSLTLAYVAAKGNKSIGDFEAKQASKVLYIDGEMAGDRLNQLCNKIIRAYEDSEENLYRPFDVYLFGECGLDYDSILDDEWLLHNKDMLFAYDLVIFDNYYSLNQNRTDVKPFIRILKEMIHKNIAVIVVDHTNSDGDLQGSITKRRATDLGIKLEAGQDNEILVDFLFDRNAVATNFKETKFIRSFTDSELKFTLVKELPQNNLDEISKELSSSEKISLYVYTLYEEYQVNQKDIATYCDKDHKRISEYYSTTKKQLKGESVERNKINNLELFKIQLNEVKNKSKEELLKNLKEALEKK